MSFGLLCVDANFDLHSTISTSMYGTETYSSFVSTWLNANELYQLKIFHGRLQLHVGLGLTGPGFDSWPAAD